MNIRLSIKQQRIIAIAVVILACLWFFWFRHYLDKQKFVRIEVDMEMLSSQLHEEFGLEEIESRKYCSREGRKFETGPLNCRISKVFPANDMNLNERDIVNFILSQPNFASATSFDEIFKLNEIDSNCYVSINSRGNIYPRLSTPPTNNEPEYLDIKCSHRATTSHFQFVEN